MKEFTIDLSSLGKVRVDVSSRNGDYVMHQRTIVLTDATDLKLVIGEQQQNVGIQITPVDAVKDLEARGIAKWCPLCMTRMTGNKDSWNCPNIQFH